MPVALQLEFGNGNMVGIYKESAGLYSVWLNGVLDVKRDLNSDDLVELLESLRKITCRINSWRAIR